MAKLHYDVGATLPFYAENLADTVTEVQTTTTLLYSYDCHNIDNAQAFIQCFDVSDADDVTLGTTTPDYVIPVPAAGTGNETGDSRLSFSRPLLFTNGLAVAATTASSGNTAADVDVALTYA